MSSKIKRALPELVENGIITEEIAQNINNYYETTSESNPNRLFIVFGILGATLVGLGIILIMAHNWDDFPKSIKLALAFAPMLIGQFILGYGIVKGKSMVWKEAATACLFFAVGACIAIVSQVYHVSGDIESYLLAWVVLCTPLLYVTKSKAAIILHLVFCTYFAVEVNFTFRGTTFPQIYFILLAVSIPRYIEMLKSKIPSASLYMLHWMFPLSLIISLPTCIESNFEIGSLLYILLFGVFYNIGQLPYFKDKSLLQNSYSFFGSLGTVIILLIMSFKDPWRFNINHNLIFFSEFISIAILFISACILLYLNNKQQKLRGSHLFQYTFLIFGAIFLIGQTNPMLAPIFVNILLLILGLVTIKIGTDKLHFGLLNYGLLIIAAVITFRFYDTDISFALRGIIFLLLGIGFFVANYIMFKKQNAKKIQP
ncbi:DUF2157 domain-containing protein [Kordia sp.]|uniref:DUF2157 domain-containing protein n=1 Tax=Kordia sp. TaxID=1965332 RepID=UPI0025BF5878|nr:DUF2157 domain-containing protein [Kordia sp.]MCH2195135.1 DUF2157 domain-containing protein [Kordia sp.]